MVSLVHWCNHTEVLKWSFYGIYVGYIFRELNSEADKLPKDSLGGKEGILHVEEYLENVLTFQGTLDIMAQG